MENKSIYILVVFFAVIIVFILYRNNVVVFKNSKNEPSQNQIKQDDSAVFSFLPEKISASIGNDFTLNIAIDPKKHNVSNADLVLFYDKTKIKLDSISGSDKFPQVLSSVTSNEGIAVYSAATNFGSSTSSISPYATLHFRALEKTENTQIIIDTKKSGIYSDDKPGANIAESSNSASISIID